MTSFFFGQRINTCGANSVDRLVRISPLPDLELVEERTDAGSAKVQPCNFRSMNQPSRDKVLAISAGWVAIVLNVIPGLGAGYLYQRRWRAYWITSALATAWFAAGAVLAGRTPAAISSRVDTSPIADPSNQLIGLIGLLVLAAVTATEAGLAVKRVRARLN